MNWQYTYMQQTVTEPLNRGSIFLKLRYSFIEVDTKIHFGENFDFQKSIFFKDPYLNETLCMDPF